MNWVFDKSATSEKDKKALEKAKILEAKRIKNGWQWVKIHEKLKTLVPFKDGEPTKEGIEMIERRKQFFGIK